jgi:hypothetical protein
MIDDWSINVKVEAELVKSWIEMRKIDFSCVGGTVLIKGAVNFQLDMFVNPNEEDYREKLSEVEAHKLRKLEARLKKISGVKAVRFNLDNWVKLGDKWVRIKKFNEA